MVRRRGMGVMDLLRRPRRGVQEGEWERVEENNQAYNIESIVILINSIRNTTKIIRIVNNIEIIAIIID